MPTKPKRVRAAFVRILARSVNNYCFCGDSLKVRRAWAEKIYDKATKAGMSAGRGRPHQPCVKPQYQTDDEAFSAWWESVKKTPPMAATVWHAACEYARKE